MKSVLFFGSFLHYSTKVLEVLVNTPSIKVVGVVTTPPTMVSTRSKKQLIKTHTHEWAQKHKLPVFAPEKLSPSAMKDIVNSLNTKYEILNTENPVDFMVVAGYGKLIPTSWLTLPKIAPINLHFSLLPAYRGANPAEWALLMDEADTGVTMIVMDEEFDTGRIITRVQIEISDRENRESLYDKLYALAGELAAETLPVLDNVTFATRQPEILNEFYAYRLKRSDGFIDWALINAAMKNEKLADPTKYLSTALSRAWRFWDEKENQIEHTLAYFVERAVRALFGYPGVWTVVGVRSKESGIIKKRMKVLEARVDNGKLVLDKVQMEGMKPARWNEVKNQIE